MKKRILAVGSADMHLTLPILKLPMEGEVLTSHGSVNYTPGGRGGDAALTVSRLGGDCVFCCKIGRDSHGESLYEFYRDNRINTEYLQIDRKHPTGFRAIFEEHGVEKRALYYPGSNRYLQDDEIRDAFMCLPDGVFLHTEMSFENVISAAECAQERNLPVFLDAAAATKEFPLEELPPVEVFLANEEETKIYTGVEPGGTDSCLRAVMELSKRVKSKYYILKLGARGAYLYNGRQCRVIPAYNEKVVDPRGCGDAFSVALALRYMENGGDIHGACEFANAAGALTVKTPGRADSVPTGEEVQAYLEAKRGNY